MSCLKCIVMKQCVRGINFSKIVISDFKDEGYSFRSYSRNEFFSNC